jgi:hypothetical protein
MSQRASTLSLSHPRTLSTECQWDGLVRKAKNLFWMGSIDEEGVPSCVFVVDPLMRILFWCFQGFKIDGSAKILLSPCSRPRHIQRPTPCRFTKIYRAFRVSAMQTWREIAATART